MQMDLLQKDSLEVAVLVNAAVAEKEKKDMDD